MQINIGLDQFEFEIFRGREYEIKYNIACFYIKHKI